MPLCSTRTWHSSRGGGTARDRKAGLVSASSRCAHVERHHGVSERVGRAEGMMAIRKAFRPLSPRFGEEGSLSAARRLLRVGLAIFAPNRVRH